MDDKELLEVIKKAAKDGEAILDLSKKGLTAIPPEIGKLVNLKMLILNGNQLTVLPSEIGKLVNLTSLYLGNNELTELPPEISKLVNLENLQIHNNQLTKLPPEFSKLVNLESLFAHSNQLTKLPPEFDKLVNLTGLYLVNNPLPIPPEILQLTGKPSEIINYYLQHLATTQKKSLNEVKMLIVGQGGVGKTSLIKRLVDGVYNPHEIKTEGIDIRKWHININDNRIRLNIWDFGGQEIMHATHQFFLTKRSLYILVLDGRQGERESRIEYWLKLIQSFGGDSPIIVVINKVDQHRLDIDRRGLQSKYETIKAFIETSCEKDIGFAELKDNITTEISRLEHTHDQLLNNWFAVKTKLEEMKQDYISLEEYQRMCEAEGISDELSQKTLIRFLHDLGIVLSFQDDLRFSETNVLNPEWVTNGVYRILNSNLLFQSKGVLAVTDLNRILDKREYPNSKHRFIIEMMEKFELCFGFEGQKEFLIPDLLSKEEPDLNWQYDDSLAFQYHYNFLPGSVISRFIVRMHPYISQKTYWRTGVVLKHQGNRALVKADLEDRQIFIYVTGREQTRRAFLEIIRADFDRIHKTIPKIEAKEKVPLPGRQEIVADYNHLLDLESLGEETFVPEGLKEKMSVKKLLDGIEPEELRKEKQEVRMWEDIRLQMNLPPQPAIASPAPRINPALAVSLFLISIAGAIGVFVIASNYAHPSILLIVPVAFLLVMYFVAGFLLRILGLLSEDSLMKLIIESFKHLSLLKDGKSANQLRGSKKQKESAIAKKSAR